MDYRVGLLFGSLIIVTGPTVIAPILRSVKPNKNLSTILKWEGIVIDPIGALVAVLIYELFFVSTMGVGGSLNGSYSSGTPNVFLTVCVGSFFGLFSGWALHYLLKKELIPHFLINVISLGFVLFAFAGADSLQAESGLLSVTVMGILMMANIKTPNIEQILDFKESLTVILISVLFIILSSNISMSQLQLLEINSLIHISF